MFLIRKVWLDDLRPEPHGWVRTFTVEQTIAEISKGDVGEISLDNDLGEGNFEGYKVLDWLEERVYNKKIKPPVINIHTANSVSYRRMSVIRERINKMSERGVP